MSTFLNKAKNIFLYCGLTKDEYNSLKKDAYFNNFMVWKYLHIFMTIGFSAICIVMSLSEPGGIAGKADFFMAVYSGVMVWLFSSVLDARSITGQLLIYLTMIMLIISSLIIGISHPDSVSVTFIVMLVTFPMFMIDYPFYMAILISVAVVMYLGARAQFVPRNILRIDAVYCSIFGAFGILINIFYNFLKVRELSLQKKQKALMEEQDQSSRETAKLNKTLRKMSESALDLLGDIVESRDEESGEHVRRVKGFTYILASRVMHELPEYELDEYSVDLMTFTASLHDVGKICIPDEILNKPGKLTREEFEIMKTHCEKGCSIIGKMKGKWSTDYLNMGMDICRYHHEKWDGRGYPKGLKGDEIPIAAQIVSIADCYDALTTKRVYKDAYSPDTAYNMILNGECGAFSEKMMRCFAECKEEFEACATEGTASIKDPDFELVSTVRPDDSFVIGIHSQDRTLQEKVRLSERVSVLESLSEDFFYVCYVNMETNEIIRFKADERFARILDSFGTQLKSYEKFDRLLNTIILADDYEDFRKATHREECTRLIQETGSTFTDFRIRLEDGIHFCRMKISLSPTDSNAVIIGIAMRDKEHAKETEYLNMQQELENARKEIINREKLADRLAVIDCISNEYDYVCTLNAETMEVHVYRAEAWIRDMFKNLEDIVVSPEVRNNVLKGIIYPDDFESFLEGSMHQNVMKGLQANGEYTVDYRAYKYGKLVNYQTRYTLDKNDPKRIIIGLRDTDR